MTEVVFDGELYAANTAHHRGYDGMVLADAGLRPGAHVLDLGCGSGDLTATVARIVGADTMVGGRTGGYVMGIDSSETQIEYARRHHAAVGLDFRPGRARDLASLVPPGSFDVVISVAMLHWVPREDQPRVLAGVHSALRPGGTFRADLGGRGQVEGTRTLLDQISRRYDGAESPWFFPDEEEYRALLVAAGFVVNRARLVAQRRSMPGKAELEGWLRSQVLPAYLPTIAPQDRDDFVAEVLATLPERVRRPAGSYDQDFVRMDVVAIRP